MLNEASINCFLTLARTLNFTKTGKLLSFSQQAVSQMIQRLEDDIGVKLFVRTNHHVAITPEGEQFYELFSRFKEEYLALCVSTKALSGDDSPRVLNTGYQDWIEHGIEAKLAYDEMHLCYPRLETNVVRRTPDSLINGLLNNELDFAVMYESLAPAAMDEIRITRLMDTDKILIVPASHPLATPDATYADFVNEPFIINVFENESDASIKQRVKAELSLLAPNPSREVIYMRDREAVYTTVELGNGIALSTSVSRVLRSYDVKWYPVGACDTIVCAWKWSPGDKLIERYVNCLQNAYKTTGRMAQKPINEKQPQEE